MLPAPFDLFSFHQIFSVQSDICNREVHYTALHSDALGKRSAFTEGVCTGSRGSARVRGEGEVSSEQLEQFTLVRDTVDSCLVLTWFGR